MQYYCYVWEDLKNLPETDPLYIQFQYAKSIGKALLCDLSSKRFSCPESCAAPDLHGKRTMLRASCGTYASALALLTEQGAQPAETFEDILRIHRWYEMELTRRTIIPVKSGELIEPDGLNISGNLFKDTETVFLKTVDKGFSLQISMDKLRTVSDDFVTFMRIHCPTGKEELLLSPWCCIKKDSLGPVEARFFVINGRILNSSRFLHSVKHSVSGSIRRFAADIVEKISRTKDFPTSYVLDIAMFESEEGFEADVEEINPLSTSMCYINNSVFDFLMPECRSMYKTAGWGYEYCLDAAKHPERYFLDRAGGITYQYVSENRFILV